jgi:hypothetical protein
MNLKENILTAGFRKKLQKHFLVNKPVITAFGYLSRSFFLNSLLPKYEN